MKALPFLLCVALTGCGMNPDWLRSQYSKASLDELKAATVSPIALQRQLAEEEIERRRPAIEKKQDDLLNQMVRDGKIRARFKDEIKARKVALGMNYTEVFCAWGTPDKINRTLSASGHHEQCIWRRGGYRSQYVHFLNGVATYISES